MSNNQALMTQIIGLNLITQYIGLNLMTQYIGLNLMTDDCRILDSLISYFYSNVISITVSHRPVIHTKPYTASTNRSSAGLYVFLSRKVLDL